MTDFSVCAVVITYHPNSGMIENISAAIHQLSGLVVVDNGSYPDELLPLRNAREDLGFHLIENGDNLGIAEALNRGVRWALGEGFDWLILFDQDSRVTEGFVDKMRASWECHPERARIGSLQPRYVDPETGFEARVWRAPDGGPVKSMTSGSLMPRRIFEAIGFFAADYFVDDVDTEYFFRIRAAGYLIADSRSAELLHSSGNPKKMTLLGFSFSPSHHSATRRYYISRNRIAVCRKYWRVFPGWVFKYAIDCFRETVKCMIGERDRMRKFHNIILGTWDGMLGKTGKWERV